MHAALVSGWLTFVDEIFLTRRFLSDTPVRISYTLLVAYATTLDPAVPFNSRNRD